MDMNIDVKDLFAKLKKGGGSGDKGGAKGTNPFVKFFEKNPKMKVILPIFLVMIAAVVAVVFIVNGVKTETDLDTDASRPQGQAVDMMPMLERPLSADFDESENPFTEDVIANAKLRGIMYNSNGYYTAIVETKTHSFVLQAGDYVSDSEWLVDKITADSVTFSMGEKTRTIELKK